MSSSKRTSSPPEGGRGDVCTPQSLGERARRVLAGTGDEDPPAPPEGGRVILSWSGGKDSAMALHRLRLDERYEVVGLLTTVSRQYRRISHHGVREELLQQQVDAIGLPLHRIYFGSEDGGEQAASMVDFENAMTEALAEFRADDVYHVAYGDIFLQDLRAYRQKLLASVGMRGVFPLWQKGTRDLLHRFTRDGFRAVVTCAEPIASSLAGVELSGALLAESWPDGVDPCGERGEFHSFVYDGPIFERPVPFTRGETIVRDGRHYTDLIPSAAAGPDRGVGGQHAILI